MEITTKLDAVITIKTVLREDKLTATASISLPYGSKGRMAGAFINTEDENIPADKRFTAEQLEAARVALMALRDSVLVDLSKRGTRAAAVALDLAVRNKEEL